MSNGTSGARTGHARRGGWRVQPCVAHQWSSWRQFVGDSIVDRTAALVALIVGVLLVPSVPDADVLQKGQLFDYTSLEDEDIRDRQGVENVLGAIRSQPTTMGIDLIKMNVELLDSLTSRVSTASGKEFLETKELLVIVTLPSGKLVEFNDIYVERTLTGFFVSGSHPDMTVDLSLSVFEGKALGNIHAGKDAYFVSSLEGVFHALTRIDRTKFKREHRDIDELDPSDASRSR